jgi:transcriptional regulator with XRE-family HTH domain
MIQIAGMQKILNAHKAQGAMDAAGLSQSAVAEALDVSREAVSQWLRAQSFPRPNKLLQLGKLLDLSVSDLVIAEDPHAPKVAFRKMKGTKTRDHHIEKAREMGRYLRHLVPYLPFDTLKMPPALKAPVCEYDYLQRVAAQVRSEIGVTPREPVDFQHLIRHFAALQTVVVPVLWGAKQRHENAVHIYLPDSQTTWVYLNLDTNIHDFKFWMAHELGHCLSPSLEGEEAEDFADAFAGCLLFPHAIAEEAYDRVYAGSSASARIKALLSIANEHVISPLTVERQVKHYASATGRPLIELSQGFHGAITNFNKGYQNLSAVLFPGSERDTDGRPLATDYVERSEAIFATPFFRMLSNYLKQLEKGPGFLEVVLDLPPLDARSLHAELT